MAKSPKKTVDADRDGHDDETGQFVSPNPGSAGDEGLPMAAETPSEPESEATEESDNVVPGLAREFADVINPAATVGRIVHYYRNAADGPYAAIVTAVNDATPSQVALTVFDPLTGPTTRFDVPYVEDVTSNTQAWRWPGFGYSAPPSVANIGSISPEDTLYGVKRT